MDTGKLENTLRNRWFWAVPPIMLYIGVLAVMSIAGLISGRGIPDEQFWLIMLIFGPVYFPIGFFATLGISGGAVEPFFQGFRVLIPPTSIYLAYGLFIYKVKTITTRQLYTIAIIIAIFVLLTIKGCSTMSYNM